MTGTIQFSHLNGCYNSLGANSHDHTLAQADTSAGAGDSCPMYHYYINHFYVLLLFLLSNCFYIINYFLLYHPGHYYVFSLFCYCREAAVGQGYSHKFNLNLLGADLAYLN